MEIESYIEKIIENNNIDDMHKLATIFAEIMKELEKYNINFYKEQEIKLYEMAFGKNINQRMAEKIVHNMKPYGQRWAIEEIDNIQKQYGLTNFRTIDFYVVMNSAFNDYNNIFDDNIEKYIKFTKDFIDDEDAKPEKVFLYYLTIPNN